MPRMFVYVSTAAAGLIDVFELDPATGGLTARPSCPVGDNVMPMALSPDQRLLYAVIRKAPFRVAVFAVDPTDGLLSPAGSAPLPASMPYVALADGGRLLLTASYSDDCAAVLRLGPDGLPVGEAAAAATLRHAHSILPDPTGRFAYVPCLGSDVIMQFRIDAEKARLEPLDPATVPATEGCGPRHGVFSPDGSQLYVLGEFSGEILRYAVDGTTGRLTLLDATQSVDPAFGYRQGAVRVSAGEDMRDRSRDIWCADLAITPDGRFLFATERTGSTIATLGIDAGSGRLTRLGHVPTEAQPRGIRLDPTGRFLIATGEKSGWITAYGVHDGRLEPRSRAPVSAGANWAVVAHLG
jgi:6-phosphogluconolactonase